ncbi:MAG TPA: cytochrome c biogenesis protein CcdA [Actinomycetes bacterium]|jgi:cytochrome c-type biogenesis protein|nr:cytochrome c biogenesis protein CcdA [Actinomycetes bacterium]
MSASTTITDGSLLLALPLAAAAGLVSFLSPCVLPLVPGYLAYTTGLSAAEVFDDAGRRRGRLVLGALLFVAGFTVVFVSAGVLLGSFGSFLLDHQDALQRWLGAFTIVMGLAFIGVLPWLQRDVRIDKRPAVGLAGAPLLGAAFGLGWSPCLGPTLGAVMALGLDQGTALRGGLLAVAYCLGLGLPFVVTALAFGRAMTAFGWVKRHYLAVMRTGGGLLVVIGLLLVTGAWDQLVQQLQVWVNGFTVAV